MCSVRCVSVLALRGVLCLRLSAPSCNDSCFRERPRARHSRSSPPRKEMGPRARTTQPRIHKRAQCQPGAAAAAAAAGQRCACLHSALQGRGAELLAGGAALRLGGHLLQHLSACCRIQLDAEASGCHAQVLSAHPPVRVNVERLKRAVRLLLGVGIGHHGRHEVDELLLVDGCIASAGADGKLGDERRQLGLANVNAHRPQHCAQSPAVHPTRP
mmetsp:Transcript_3481/g.14388  ORF Transcript_3481/g.14388 Transcript_3481/m.14388 type:complete len:215 (-) Transcript_3481:242-886(-)